MPIDDIPDGIPDDPEWYDLHEELGYEPDDGDQEEGTVEEERDDTTDLSYKEMGLALGFGQEMIQGEMQQFRQKPDGIKRRVDTRQAEPAQKARKKHPIDELLYKLERLNFSYHELRAQLLQSHQAERSGYLARNIDDLNLNICLDLINLMDECIIMRTTDAVWVLVNDRRRMVSPQMIAIQRWLKEKK